MDSFNNITFSFNFKELPYQRLPDVQFGSNDENVLGEMYNDALDDGANDLSFLNKYNWKNFAWCFYKLKPGYWIPPHIDHYENYSKHYGINDKSKIMRTLLFLEDWKPGHVFGCDKEIITGWKKFDSYTWKHDAEHWGGNFGTEDRYTIQLTGVIQ